MVGSEPQYLFSYCAQLRHFSFTFIYGSLPGANTGYPELLKIVAKVIEGSPKVEPFELSISTLHKLAAKA